jgi:hypothetical protein
MSIGPGAHTGHLAIADLNDPEHLGNELHKLINAQIIEKQVDALVTDKAVEHQIDKIIDKLISPEIHHFEQQVDHALDALPLEHGHDAGNLGTALAFGFALSISIGGVQFAIAEDEAVVFTQGHATAAAAIEVSAATAPDPAGPSVAFAEGFGIAEAFGNAAQATAVAFSAVDTLVHGIGSADAAVEVTAAVTDPAIMTDYLLHHG